MRVLFIFICFFGISMQAFGQRPIFYNKFKGKLSKSMGKDVSKLPFDPIVISPEKYKVFLRADKDKTEELLGKSNKLNTKQELNVVYCQ